MNPKSEKPTIPAYIINVHPLLINDGIVWDIFYVREKSRDLYCLRIFNIQLSFLIARLPNLSASQFERYINSLIPEKGKYKLFTRTDLADSSFFNFQNNREYIEVFSSNPKDLNNFQTLLEKIFKPYYTRIRENELSPEDALFYRNTETPFRYTSTTLTLPSSIYNLSTKYNVPLVGGITIDTSRLTRNYPQEYLPDFDRAHISGLDAQTMRNWNPTNVNENITLTIKRDESIDFKQNLTMFAYDIETYNPDGNLDPNIEEYYIFCIGIGVFDLNNTVPHERFCLISKDIGDNIVNPDTEVTLKSTQSRLFGRKAVTVYNEYQSYLDNSKEPERDKDSSTILDSDNVNDLPCDEDDDASTLRGGSGGSKPLSKYKNSKVITIDTDSYKPLFPDQTTYIICKNEKDILVCFNQIVTKYHPQIITGFNSFGFDDNYMHTRMVLHALDQDYLQCFTFYDILSEDSIVTQWWFKPFIPQFKQFDLKIDNEPRHDNNSVRAWSVLNVDVYKMMLKEDPKRFTQYGRGNLDTMLEVYDIHNPFNHQPLSKTGLKIHEMYRRWIANENIYSVALYCTQDSWITGTLLIERAKLSDLIEMAGISCTSFSDSIYQADGVRVAKCILSYAYNENFALMDSPYKLRSDVKKDPLTPRLGGKTYDHRTIVGGQVRNIHAGRNWFVVALDYSAMYPSQKEASNIDSSSRIDDDIIKHPEKYNIDIVRKLNINDMYGKREVFYVKKK